MSCTVPEPMAADSVSGVAITTFTSALSPRSAATLGSDLAQDRARRQEIGQLGAIDAAQLDELRHVVHEREVGGVGEPVARDGVVRRGELPGEPQVQVVHRLEQLVGLPVDLGSLVLQEQDVTERVLAGVAGDALGVFQPEPRLAGIVTSHVDRALGDLAGAWRPARPSRSPRCGGAGRSRRRAPCPSTGS